MHKKIFNKPKNYLRCRNSSSGSAEVPKATFPIIEINRKSQK